jgi:hypothetical protein
VEYSKVLISLTHVTRFFEGKVLPHSLHVAELGIFRENSKLSYTPIGSTLCCSGDSINYGEAAASRSFLPCYFDFVL